MTGTEIREALRAAAEAWMHDLDGCRSEARQQERAKIEAALSALAGMCVLPVEVVRGLIDAGLDSSVHDAGAESGCHACAALAAAEAEVARAEGER